MKNSLVPWVVSVVLAASSLAWADRPLKDYSFIRGVNYEMYGDQSVLERDLGYAKRLNLNATRTWLTFDVYEKDPKGFAVQLRNYVRIAHRLGLSTMFIIWDGNELTPEMLKPEFRARGDAYVKAAVEAVKDEPGLLMWDVVNEPVTNDYVLKAEGEERKRREAQITEFVRYNLTLVRKLDPVNALTVGYALSSQVDAVADLEDVITFHDYTPRRSAVEQAYSVAEQMGKKYGKPILNSETGCIARANPYDMVLEIAEEHKTGWYLFELMVEGYWGEIHGIFYADGTVRDPSVVAAILGFHRNRDLSTIVPTVPNREGNAAAALKAIEESLGQKITDAPPGGLFHPAAETDKILDAAEEAANMLEAAEMVPMDLPPTAQILYWRKQPAEKRDWTAIRKFAYQLGLELKKDCLIY